MRERVRLLGGTLETGPRDEGGYRVAARLPVDGGAA
jgi:signal transduction histidine kinase